MPTVCIHIDTKGIIIIHPSLGQNVQLEQHVYGSRGLLVLLLIVNPLNRLSYFPLSTIILKTSSHPIQFPYASRSQRHKPLSLSMVNATLDDCSLQVEMAPAAPCPLCPSDPG